MIIMLHVGKVVSQIINITTVIQLPYSSILYILIRVKLLLIRAT